jgi:hypothetical protein
MHPHEQFTALVGGVPYRLMRPTPQNWPVALADAVRAAAEDPAFVGVLALGAAAAERMNEQAIAARLRAAAIAAKNGVGPDWALASVLATALGIMFGLAAQQPLPGANRLHRLMGAAMVRRHLVGVRGRAPFWRSADGRLAAETIASLPAAHVEHLGATLQRMRPALPGETQN